ncbi:menaquinone-dependent protoporphyrinogen IX dehydrogenase [soil metagenome]
MKPFAVLHATREGQTLHIAEHVAAALRARGHAAEVIDVRSLPGLDLERFASAAIVASVHVGRHDGEVVDFVNRHRAALEHMPSYLLSISLSEAVAEDASSSAEVRRKAADDVRSTITSFLEATGWHPARVQAAAGALRVGAPADTPRDYEYTDWPALERFVDEIVAVTDRTQLDAPSSRERAVTR